MKKDIDIPVVEDVYVAIVYEWDDEMLTKVWNAYLINNKETAIEMAIIVSNGSNDTDKTATIRHGLGTLEGKSFKKFEPLQEEIFALDNVFSLSFFSNNRLFDKKYIFKKNTISSKALTTIPLIGKEGIITP
ncbi:hypothetical protein Celal_1255 [Cellulophaga algicola DSM 14237]|uniref:Phenylalanyl-tRNA synthetase subunit alpha n=1 Tax=Cellulophaga algicola (strain DSM 14237 / IC166 / ACAM 630) TaxID=688270 RepID=E6X7B7_CELAD|nr:hypothetical protein [Cellulophaga algicola]ADV48570.1 hypothetical protein Celal_1255 [Cellulophaga algicola DSM 14237]